MLKSLVLPSLVHLDTVMEDGLRISIRGGRSVRILECSEGSWEGGNVWPPAYEIVEHLNGMETLEVLSVLECGAGCGFAGIASALLGARRVVLSDLPVALPTLRANLVANGLVENDALELAILDWTALEQPLLASATPVTFDLILASECLYSPDMVVPLLSTAHRACSASGTLLLAGIIGAVCCPP